MKNFADNLRKIRGNKELSQEELAKKIKVHPTHYSRYERGLSLPSIDVVQRIADVLEVSIDELVYGSQDVRVEGVVGDKELLTLFGKIRSMGNKEKTTVKDLISAFVLKADLKKNLIAA